MDDALAGMMQTTEGLEEREKTRCEGEKALTANSKLHLPEQAHFLRPKLCISISGSLSHLQSGVIYG